MSELFEKQISREEIFKGVAMHLVRDKIELPDGTQSVREISLHNGASAVIPILPDGRVIMVRQYRYAHGKVMLEIPAGKLDTPDEDPTSAVIRELREETGAKCERLTFLGMYYPSPAILDERISMYLAEGLSFGETDFDDDEFLEIVKVPLCDLVDMVLDGKIRDGKTQIGVLRAALMLARRESKEKC